MPEQPTGADEQRARHNLLRAHRAYAAPDTEARKAIEPTAVIPAGEPLPPRSSTPGDTLPKPAPRPPAAPPPAYIPPAPPPPPSPPARPWTPAPDPGPSQGYLLIPIPLEAPAPEPRWWQRVRWVYNGACILAAMPVTGPVAWVLADIRDSQGLAGAWLLAAVPLVVVATLDNARRVEAEAAHPHLWAPKIRAAAMRTLLWAVVIATVTTLPVETVVLVLTGVRP
ncbi:hypothetical protein [Streptomyces jumonjinensis]|uniref:hypothetical protein n=1 Tax=Streptomyces jumonjinensis TaxID=1945 RepID=UPI00379C2AB4